MDEKQLLEGIPPEEMEGFLAWREKVADTNISNQTLLATDYLNHFNEIIMLLEMVPDMPDMLEECKCWEPKSYQEHFRDSSFSDKDLAIEAYDHVPTKFRRPFEEIVAQMNRTVQATIGKVDECLNDEARAEQASLFAVEGSRAVQKLMDFASAVIHGSDKAMAQAEIDGLLADQ